MGRRSRSRSRSSSRDRDRDRYSRSRSRTPDGARLHVGDLGIDCSRREIEKAFEKYGDLIEVFVARTPPCFAFVVYKNREDAEDAMRGMDGSVLCGGRVKVSFARPRNKGIRRRRSFDPNLRCFQCGERGHFARDCEDISRYRNIRRSRSRDRSRRTARRSRSHSRSRDRGERRSREEKSRRSPSRSRSRSMQRSPSRSRSRSMDRSKAKRSTSREESESKRVRQDSEHSRNGDRD